MGIILIAIFIGVNITKSSYALFSDRIVSTNTIEVEVENNIPNPPVLDTHMVPVYYNEESGTWNKADETNQNSEYKWYDYNNKIWANSITYDNTIVDDLASSDNNGKINGALYQKDGMSFDGENDYVDAGYSNYDFNNQLTVIARFKSDAYTTTGGVLVDNYTYSDSKASGFEFFVGATNGRIVLQFFSAEDNSKVYLATNQTTELNTWYTAVATYDGETMKIYLNGELQNEKALTPEEINSISTSGPIYLGANPYMGGMHLFPGTISNAILINDCLTEEEIQKYYSDKITYHEHENTLFNYDLRGYEGKENGSTIPMNMIKTIQVWVPRYKYKVWNYNSDGIKTSKPQEIKIKFERGTASTGNMTCADNIQGEEGDGTSEICRLKSTNKECTDDTCNNKYYTHPAFTFGEEELEGFWVGKFELTGEIDNITTKPNLSSLISYRIGDFSNNIMAMNDESNIYGFSSSADTHMIKNMEWGAISYLANSKYGLCTSGTCHEMGKNNNSNYITGCGSSAGSSSSSSCNSYNTELGMLASTTGNIYGVYDMHGGAWDYVMGNMVSSDGTTMLSGLSTTSNSGYTGVVYASGTYVSYTGDYNYPHEKYYDKYSFGTSYNDNSAFKRLKLGDGTREAVDVSLSGVIQSSYPWFVRGASYNINNENGIFTTGRVAGNAVISGNLRSTRIIIDVTN